MFLLTVRYLQLDPSLSFDDNSILAQPSETERQVQINMSDLVERLALSAICMGGPGPGFLPSDVDNVLERLTSTANRMLC